MIQHPNWPVGRIGEGSIRHEWRGKGDRDAPDWNGFQVEGLPAVMVFPTDETSWIGLANAMMAFAALMSGCAWVAVNVDASGNEFTKAFTWKMKPATCWMPRVGLPAAKLAAAPKSSVVKALPLPLFKAPVFTRVLIWPVSNTAFCCETVTKIVSAGIFTKMGALYEEVTDVDRCPPQQVSIYSTWSSK